MSSIRQAERSAPPGLEAFMHALGAVESGNSYDAVGPNTGSTYGRARGRWQVMEKIYPAWAREAGVDPNDYSPAAQERVVRKKMTDYYNRYGSWELVAVAWLAGPGRADRAKRSGIAAVGGLQDMLGTSVSTYVQKVMGGMRNGAPSPENPRQADAALGAGSVSQRRPPQPKVWDGSLSGGSESYIDPAEAAANDPMAQQRRSDQIGQDTMAGILDTISQASRGKGGQVLDLKAFLGMPNAPQEAAPQFTGGLPVREENMAGAQPEPEEVPPTPEAADPENPRQADGPLAPPPKHDGFAKLTAGAQTGSQRLMAQHPGLRFTSGYRDPQRNAAAGGVKNSKHLTGQASDFVGTEAEMQAAAASAKAMGAKTLIHDSGSGRHLHIEWP